MTKDILKFIAIKSRLHKKMCRSKDPINKKELETKVKIARKYYFSFPEIVKQTILITSSVGMN